MTDVQMSNARRIGFTALALTAFWVLGWNAYWMGFEDGTPIGIGGRQWNTATQSQMEVLDLLRFLRKYTSICFAIPPAILLSFAIYNWPLNCLRGRENHRDRRMLTAIILFIISIEVCYRLGESDAGATQGVSWFWLLTPIILTTMFLIIAARRTVRDAEVEAVDEDE